MNARTAALMLSMVFGFGACADDTPEPGRAQLRLVRHTDGFVDLEISGATQNPRAIQAEIEIESEATMLVEDTRSAPGLGTDTVRSASLGTNHTMLFVGDKRGLLLPKDGVVARFKVIPSGGSSSAEASARIRAATVVSGEPAPIEVELGGAITVR